MVAEIVTVSALFLGCLRLRGVFGLVPLYTLLGVVFYTCNFLAAGVYVRIAPDIVVSPGTVAFFPSMLFVVLSVYIAEDAIEARKLIYGLLLTNIFAAALGWLTALHLQIPGALNAYNLSPSFMAANPRVSTVSVIALYIDTIVIILLYELISRYTRSLYLRIWVSLSIMLVVDTLMFITGAYVESPAYLTILTSAMIGKLLSGTLYSALFATYFRYFDPAPPSEVQAIGTMFRTLTYRQKYELLRESSIRDSLTGLYNRGFFDEILVAQLSTAVRAHAPLAVLMADIDHFKSVNDEKGHVEGDRVLTAVATALASSFRSSDYVCRYGGEEFTIVLPSTDERQAAALAEKARLSVSGTGVTLTIGVAVFPSEAASPRELLLLADRRLYEGKLKGRNRVVSSNPLPST